MERAFPTPTFFLAGSAAAAAGGGGHAKHRVCRLRVDSDGRPPEFQVGFPPPTSRQKRERERNEQVC